LSKLPLWGCEVVRLSPGEWIEDVEFATMGPGRVVQPQPPDRAARLPSAGGVVYRLRADLISHLRRFRIESLHEGQQDHCVLDQIGDPFEVGLKRLILRWTEPVEEVLHKRGESE